MESRPPDRSGFPPLLELEDIHLAYGSTEVLENVNLSIQPGEIHALVGEHGAGKSSLCFVMSGRVRPTSGSLFFEGKGINGLTVKKARGLGIEMVNQNNPLFENLSIADNLFVSRGDISSFPWFSRRRHIERARQLLRQHRFAFDPETPLRNLDPSDRYLIGILKNFSMRPRLIILDESLDKLKVSTFDRIIDILNQLKAEGASVLFVTHRIDDIYQIADRVTILRGGEIYVSDSVKNIDKINLIKLAYTQISKYGKHHSTRQEFYQLLKYNEAILQKLPANLIVVDNGNRIKMVNEWSRRFFNLAAADSYNLPLWTLFKQQNQDSLELVSEELRGGRREPFSTFPSVSERRYRRNNITVQPIYDGSFQIGSMIIIDDITEQEKLREQMVLSEKLASLGLLAAGVAHEINNPLEAIHNFSEYLKFAIQEPRAAEILSHIDEEIVSISHIVANLISFSDSDEGGGETFDLNDLIENMLALVRFNGKNRSIGITFHRSAKAVRLKAHQSEIKQVILNLLKNSFDAMPRGGRISITTRVLRGAASPRAEMTLQDTGTGISLEKPGDVFLPFYSTKGQRDHLGLGLSISYGIIKKYNGEISVSNLSKGCMFRITLPLAQDDGP